jgi:hypothetical protein
MKCPQLIIQDIRPTSTEIRAIISWTPYTYTVWGVTSTIRYDSWGPWRLSERSLRNWLCIESADLLLYLNLPNKSPLFDKILSGEYKI